jgi:transposase
MDIVRDSKVHSGRKTVSKWIKRFEEAEADGMPDEEAVLSQPHTGRPPTVTNAVKKLMLKYCRGKRKRSTRKCAKWLRSKGIKISASTVGRHLLDEGLYPYRRPRQPFLNAKQKNGKLKFTRDHVDHD